MSEARPMNDDELAALARARRYINNEMDEAEREQYLADMVSDKRIAICPHDGCVSGLLRYERSSDVTCSNGHRFRHYIACGGLLPIDPETFRTIGPMYVSDREVVRMLDLGARIHNALVWYSGDKHKFWWRLLDVMESLRDEAHRGYDGTTQTTQMDIEVERLREALTNGTHR